MKPTSHTKNPASVWDEDAVEEQEPATRWQILRVIGWIVGYLVIGLAGVPLVGWMLFRILTAGASPPPDIHWEQPIMVTYLFLIAGLPTWLFGFPVIYFAIRKWIPVQGTRYCVAAMIGVSLSLAAMWALIAF